MRNKIFGVGLYLSVMMLLVSSPALARKTLIVGVGNCRDAALVSATRDFQQASRELLKKDLFLDDDVLAIVRNPPLRSIEDVQRQVDAAKTLLYAGQNDRGLDLIRQALIELERASPKVKPWNTQVSAWLIESQVLKNLERAKESAESYRKILRIDQTYKLDPDNFPPSTLQAFEGVRKEVSKAKRVVFQVQSNMPAMVLIDGKEVGKTPLKMELRLGSYRVQLMNQESISFPRRVNVTKDEFVQIDMQYEGAVSETSPLCLSDSDDSTALKLAQSVSADELIVVRNEARAGNPTYVRAALFDAAGKQLRDGGSAPALLKNLVTYLVTGQPQTGIDTTLGNARPAAAITPIPNTVVAVPKTPDVKEVNIKTEIKNEAIVVVKKEEPTVVDARQPNAERIPVAVPAAPTQTKSSPGQLVSGIVMGVGAAAGAAGIILYSLGQTKRDELDNKGTTPSGRLTESYEVMGGRLLLVETQENRVASFTLMGAGLGLAAAGLVGLLVFPPDVVPVTVSAGATPNSAAIQVSGSF
jgi:hypothetical protein